MSDDNGYQSAPDIKTLIGSARRAERSVQLCLRADLTAQMQDLQRQLEAAEKQAAATDSLAGSGVDVRGLAEQIEAVRKEMLGHTATFTMRAVPRRRWTELVAAHPAREGHPTDTVLGLNEDSFFEVLLKECTVAPALDDDDWKHLLDDVLSDAQWKTLTNAVWGVNCRDVDVPFSSAASRILSSSEPE